MAHTYGPTCHLARNVSFTGIGTAGPGTEDMPGLKAQFFYSSPLPIDDPLSAIPAPTGAEGKSAKHPPRPFSAYDNNFLEEAWLSLASKKERKNHYRGKSPKSDGKGSRKDSKNKGKQNKDQPEEQERLHSASSGSPSPSWEARHGDSEELHPSCDETSRHCLPNCEPERGMHAPECCNLLEPESETEPNNQSEDAPDCCIDLESEPETKSHSRKKQAKEDPECCCEPEPEPKKKSRSRIRQPKEIPECCTEPESEGESPRDFADKMKKKGNHKKQKSEDKGSKNKDLRGKGRAQASNQHLSTECELADGEETVYPAGEHNSVLEHDDPHCQLAVAEVAQSSKSARQSPLQLHSESSCELAETEATAYPRGTENRSVGEHSRSGCQMGETEATAYPRHRVVREHSGTSCQNEKAEAAAYPDETENGEIQEHKPSNCGLEQKEAAAFSSKAKSRILREHRNSSCQLDGEGRFDIANLDGSAAYATEAGTTGNPFIKYSSASEPASPVSADRSGDGNQDPSFEHCLEPGCGAPEPEAFETEILRRQNCTAHKNAKSSADVPVGISRLHCVELPSLLMKPIYWSPVHDVSVVIRGTWFYKDTMYPVEPDVANQLEKGYRELRPWSQTWNDELNSAMEVGASGEEKISHRLWPQDNDRKLSLQKSSASILSNGPQCAARCFQGEASAEGTLEPDRQPGKSGTEKVLVKFYPQSQVIYKDAQNAFILKPSLQASSYYGRKPLQKIRRGTTVGTHCVRGFDWKAWGKLHPSKKSKSEIQAEEAACVSGDEDVSTRNSCAACRSQEERPKISDLVLVIHGIGQKLSDRVESFHFTHAINSFRRSVNVELVNGSIQHVLRPDLGGVMVLPVNWRSNLSFEDGGPMKEGDKQYDGSDFTLKDITPDTIPAVRNLISDVMLDIPFYMSNHKPKMIKAVIAEANRVYRLWCKNNTEFHQKGRVHIIAHSLGSAMALEVLSKQPTSVPKVNLVGKKINSKYFDFNTTNLFFVGSPASFFLLLERGRLLPRSGQGKPEVGPSSDKDPAVVGTAGTFGCLAVDNIYNVMHCNDPIAYRLNATIDPQYAAGLRDAHVPSATTGFFESIASVVKSVTPGVAASTDVLVGEVPKPLGMTRLPSQLEMEIHDFTREEIAEKKYYQLNDNGQVDWFLSAGRGLEFQYLNMLGAHSSYWGSPDFVRLVVTECGRKPGRSQTLPNMRAVKVGLKLGRRLGRGSRGN